MSDWRDIETAPRDGTDVLLARHNRMGPMPPIVAGWFGSRRMWVAYDAHTKPVEGTVTHWWPLPSPPETENGR